MKPNNPLRLWRKAHGLRAIDVALKLGVSEQTVLAYEKGGFQPSDARFNKLAQLTETPAAVLREAWDGWRSQNAVTD